MYELVPALQADPHVVDVLEEAPKGLFCCALACGGADLQENVFCILCQLGLFTGEEWMDGDHSVSLSQEWMSVGG